MLSIVNVEGYVKNMEDYLKFGNNVLNTKNILNISELMSVAISFI